MALLEGPPVIAEDLLEGVFVDPLPCGGHSAGLYHVLAAEASWFFTLLSPSLPNASPGGTGRIRDFEKGNSYTLNLAIQAFQVTSLCLPLRNGSSTQPTRMPHGLWLMDQRCWRRSFWEPFAFQNLQMMLLSWL